MAGLMTINTDQVAAIATDMETQNAKLSDTLTESQTTIKNLSNTWQGEAATATIDGFNEFATKYFQTYHDVIDSYVKFLRMNVDQGYTETETANISLADAFK